MSAEPCTAAKSRDFLVGQAVPDDSCPTTCKRSKIARRDLPIHRRISPLIGNPVAPNAVPMCQLRHPSPQTARSTAKTADHAALSPARPADLVANGTNCQKRMTPAVDAIGRPSGAPEGRDSKAQGKPRAALGLRSPDVLDIGENRAKSNGVRRRASTRRSHAERGNQMKSGEERPPARRTEPGRLRRWCRHGRDSTPRSSACAARRMISML
jgi:hypothetical protein